MDYIDEDELISFFGSFCREEKHRSKCLAFAFYFVERSLYPMEYYFEIDKIDTENVFTEIRDYVRENIQNKDTKKIKAFLSKIKKLDPSEIQVRYSQNLKDYYFCALFYNTNTIFEYALYICRNKNHSKCPYVYSQWNISLSNYLDFWEKKDFITMHTKIPGVEMRNIILNNFGITSRIEEQSLFIKLCDYIKDKDVFTDEHINYISKIAKHNQKKINLSL
jgi:hypothetical protein